MFSLKLDNLIDDTIAIPFTSMVFNGGEHQVTIPSLCDASHVLIEISMTSASKIMQLLITTDALRRQGCKFISLFCPYLPYARQDRVCNTGEALSIKVMCDLINSQNYNSVWTLDNHSDVSTALLNNHREISLINILKRNGVIGEKTALVAPDAGSMKKINKISKAFGGRNIIVCGKERDVRTGNITKTVVYSDIVDVEEFLIIDDICDGGRTFTELAKVLVVMGGRNINLFVSHGIFSAGLDVFKGLFASVKTTKSIKNDMTDKIGFSFKKEDLT